MAPGFVKFSSARWIVCLATGVLMSAIALLDIGSRSVGAAETERTTEVAKLRDRDPILETTRRRFVVPPRLKELWLLALQRAEADLQRQAAEAIARAHEQRMLDVAETAGPLEQVLQQPGIHPVARLSIASALITLDARPSAAVLAEPLERAGLDYAQLVEPALARWDYQPQRDVWRQRLLDTKVSAALRLLAIRCLGTVRDAQSANALGQLVADGAQSAGTRLSAARALAGMPSDEVTRLAESLADGGNAAASGKPPVLMIDRLLAASLLASTDSPESRLLLLRLAEDPEPTVAAVALERLLQVAPAQVVPLADSLLTSSDSKVRLLVARSLATQPAPPQVERLARLLADPHPEVRRFARQSLAEMAALAELKPLVLQAVDTALRTEYWRALEQAGLLAATLDHDPAAGRLVELLEHSRREVLVTSAWALRVLAVPETLPAMLAYAGRQTALLREPPTAADGASRATLHRLQEVPVQLGHVFEAFGVLRYAESESLLREFVPKNHGLGDTARAAAVWSLGWLHLDEESEELAGQLAERLADLNLLDPENDEVRTCSAITLGRMKASSSMPTLRKFRAEGDGTVIGRATGWAIHRITGEPFGDPGEREAQQQGWFLEPLSGGD